MTPGRWPPQAEHDVGSDDTNKTGKAPRAAGAGDAEQGGGVWQDLARMEAELQDPEEEATQLYSREDLVKMVAADGRAGLVAALSKNAATAPGSDEEPASTTLPVDDGDEDQTLHRDPLGDDDDETEYFLGGPESATLLEDEPAAPTQARPQVAKPAAREVTEPGPDAKPPAEVPAADKLQDFASTVALDADDFADLSFDEVAVAATDLAATVALDAAPEPASNATAPKPAPSSPAKVAVAKVALARVPASQAKPSQEAAPPAVAKKPGDDESTLLTRPPQHRPSDYLRSASLSTPPRRRRRGGGDTWSIVLVAALVALAASLVFLWMRLA